MLQTPLMLELQITQEYLGHSTHLVYLGAMWKEYLEFDLLVQGSGSTLASVIDGSLYDYTMTGIAGVSNIGSDRNWTGHLFGQANWYAYGRLAWNPGLTAESIADEWIRMTLTRDLKTVHTIRDMMMGSWQACINYMTPLGLHHIMQEGFHYGPQPGFDDAPRRDWTSVYYHRADSIGIGFDRSSTGSNAVGQYAPKLCAQFDHLETCPEKYLLWFHHVPWDYQMTDGRLLWNELQFRYQKGVDYVDQMYQTWMQVKPEIDPEIHTHVQGKLAQQKKSARNWRNTCINYFSQYVDKRQN
ncbi:MAG: hypothetical protein U5R06_13680 [candidate division KSB1 bacterium]|nr:hypothetical protein [candidate division KSB1 bacterium]